MKSISEMQIGGSKKADVKALDDDHFAFGKNWESFVRDHLNQERIDEAKKSMVEFCDANTLITGRTFIDVGCGSGLFSLSVISSAPAALSASTSILSRLGAVNI
jgi:2-polyprenyl-3-methyl-5-hydroxy-6-metoxy-1,4-benzoquinol methylase